MDQLKTMAFNGKTYTEREHPYKGARKQGVPLPAQGSGSKFESKPKVKSSVSATFTTLYSINKVSSLDREWSNPHLFEYDLNEEWDADSHYSEYHSDTPNSKVRDASKSSKYQSDTPIYSCSLDYIESNVDLNKGVEGIFKLYFNGSYFKSSFVRNYVYSLLKKDRITLDENEVLDFMSTLSIQLLKYGPKLIEICDGSVKRLTALICRRIILDYGTLKCNYLRNRNNEESFFDSLVIEEDFTKPSWDDTDGVEEALRDYLVSKGQSQDAISRMISIYILYYKGLTKEEIVKELHLSLPRVNHWLKILFDLGVGDFGQSVSVDKEQGSKVSVTFFLTLSYEDDSDSLDTEVKSDVTSIVGVVDKEQGSKSVDYSFLRDWNMNDIIFLSPSIIKDFIGEDVWVSAKNHPYRVSQSIEAKSKDSNGLRLKRLFGKVSIKSLNYSFQDFAHDELISIGEAVRAVYDLKGILIRETADGEAYEEMQRQDSLAARDEAKRLREEKKKLSLKHVL